MPKDGPTGNYNSIQEKSKIYAFLQRLIKIRKKDNDQSKLRSASNKIESNMRSFAEKTVEDVMIPRSDIGSVSIDLKFEEICNSVVEHAHTRTLVYRGSLDNIVGFIHIKDLFHSVVGGKKIPIKKLLRKHIVSPHSMKLIDLLKQMQIARTHISIVVDEYGGTDGLVTIEDIIEEIVGRIDDEHDIDTEGNSYKIIRPGVVVTSARVEIEELEEVIGVKFENDCEEIDTIGGLIMTIKGCVPEKGEIVVLNNDLVIEVIESTPRTIKQLKITYPT
ncbi:MAG: HlyC/CorC family transporter [Rickettsiales bacterium]|nr:HlyC/CorC family transporter [Rickettsiales bacterium]